MDLKPDLSLPGAKLVGPTSPVYQAHLLIREFLSLSPTPNIDTMASKPSGLLVGNHLLRLTGACDSLNVLGSHSAAIVLLRPLEDALDCFAAVTMVKGAAERWSARDLKPSEAAKLWTENAATIFNRSGGSVAEYRKNLRGQFAHYMHCSYDLCLWDLYFSPRHRNSLTGELPGPYEINDRECVIDSNAHAISAHLTAHYGELLAILRHAYSRDLEKLQQALKFSQLASEVQEIMDQHDKHKCQNVLVPPEWRRGNQLNDSL